MNYNLYINDTIGWPISAGYVRSELAKCKDKHCDLYLSSLGGDVATALQIRQMLLEHGDVTAHLHGFVASAATIIATGCKEIKMGEFALFMIHKCSAWQDEWGQMNADDISAAITRLTSAKQMLDSTDHVIGSIYAQRTGASVSEIAEMMKAETWLSAEEAKEQGFVDEIISDEQPQELTAETKQRIVACGYPVPETAKEDKPSLWKRITDFIETRFQQQAQRVADETLALKEPSNTNQHLKTPEPAMNKDYKSILALLSIEAIACTEDGSATLTAFQLQQIEAALAVNADKLDTADKEKKTLEKQVTDLTSEKSALENKVSDLTAQVEALQKADGADTTKVEGQSSEETAMSYATRARANYDKIKNLIA